MTEIPTYPPGLGTDMFLHWSRTPGGMQPGPETRNLFTGTVPRQRGLANGSSGIGTDRCPEDTLTRQKDLPGRELCG